MEKFPHWVDHILAFIFCIAIPVYSSWQRPGNLAGLQFSTSDKKQIYLSGSFSLFILGFIVMAEWLLFKRPLAEAGFTQPHDFNTWWWVLIIFWILYIGDTVIAISQKNKLEKTIDNWKRNTPFMPTGKEELPQYLLLCFSAGVFEEIAYRGYLITYCLYLFNGSPNKEMLAVIIPGAVFSVAHYYQGKKGVIKIFILSLFFGFIFIKSGSLLIVMLLHFLVDAIGGLLTMKYFKEDKVEMPV
jgi:membrane protease YdiL (CAAX protease family)